MKSYIKKIAAFSIMELVIVVGIVGVSIGIAGVMLNAPEYLRESRDSRRIADINLIKNAVNIYRYDNLRPVYMGDENTVYVSLPDTASDCSNLQLPELDPSWTYHCVTEDTLTNTDGTGWIPINFESKKVNISSLPIDPVNSAESGLYYTYIYDQQTQSFRIAAEDLESNRYSIGGKDDKTSTDEGGDDYSYEGKEGVNTNIYSYGDNIVSNTNLNHLIDSYDPGWDTSLNGTMRPESGFSSGYDVSVTNPSIGYHAHVSDTEGLGGSGCFKLEDKNCQFGLCHRSLSFYQTWPTPGSSMNWQDGTALKVKFIARNDNPDKQIQFGFKRWSNQQNDYVIDLVNYDTNPPKNKTWKIIKHAFNITSDWDVSNHDVSLIFFGNYGNEEGTIWIDNVQVEYYN